MTGSPEYGALIERLTAERYVREGRDEQDYVCDLSCDAEDDGARAVPRNPDGPEAAQAIRDLVADRERLATAMADIAALTESKTNKKPLMSQPEFAVASVNIIARAALSGGEKP